ncbi:MAG TPA: hypothetical protein VKS25_00325 [Solirubrobacteraceae bacterium]|nr:hypothetical protein [Solirubrobacteraceae bacterium]
MHRFRTGRGGSTTSRSRYANVVATLALFLALAGGTAYAARHYLIHSIHQIKPAVVRELRGNRGPSGPRGLRGSRGLTGPAGKTGKTGATGTTGVSGATGFTATLPSGKTEIGTWAGDVGTSDSPYYAAVSFDIPLAAKPTVNFVAPGGSSTTACPGSVAAPAAASGNLCVYEAHVEAGITLAANDPNHDPFNTNADTFGTVISLTTSTTGAAYGTWAVTG